MLIILFALGQISCNQVLKQSHFQNNDPSYIVIDEVVGIWLTMMVVAAFKKLAPIDFVGGFLLFRFFDIVKPWPIGWLDDKLSKKQSTAAFGIMIDDVLAGLAAPAVLLLIIKFFHS